MSQLGLPTVVSARELTRERTLGSSIGLAAKVAGYEPKEVCDALKMDRSQWSRWESGAEGVIWPKLSSFMDFCGNDAPLLWMNHTRGYDLGSIRKVESETERKLRTAYERIAELEDKDRRTIEIIRELRA